MTLTWYRHLLTVEFPVVFKRTDSSMESDEEIVVLNVNFVGNDHAHQGVTQSLAVLYISVS
jgi:hypothetical protein